MSRTFKDKPYKLTPEYDRWREDQEHIEYVNEDGNTRYATIYKRTVKPKKKRSVNVEKHWYHQTPGWWVNEFMEVPMRARNKLWDSRLLKTPLEELDTLDTPNHGRKPFIYYW